MVRRLLLACSVVLLGSVVAACSGSVEFSFGGKTPAAAAVELIEGDAMAQRLGIAPITDAVCEDPADTEVGTIFTCTSQSDGQTVNFEVLLEEDDRIFAGPTNVVDTLSLTRLETTAVQELNRANDFGLADDAMDCGDESVILDSSMQMICALTEPETGTIYDAQVTINDTDTGDFNVVILGETE